MEQTIYDLAAEKCRPRPRPELVYDADDDDEDWARVITATSKAKEALTDDEKGFLAASEKMIDPDICAIIKAENEKANAAAAAADAELISVATVDWDAAWVKAFKIMKATRYLLRKLDKKDQLGEHEKWAFVLCNNITEFLAEYEADLEDC